MKTTFLYTLSDPETGKIRYLGKSDNPFKRYKAHLRGKEPSHKTNWISQLKSKGLVPYMDLLDEVPCSQHGFWEREYIRVFRAIGFDLVNQCDGGGGLENPSAEVRAKMSASHIGVPMSPEHIAARTASQAGKKRVPKTTESKVKQSETMKALWADPEANIELMAARKATIKPRQLKLFRAPRNPATPETKAKMSASHTGVKLSPEHVAARVKGQTGTKRAPRSEEAKAKQSESMKGKEPWNKGLRKVII